MDNFFSANGSITPGFLPGPANGSSNGNLAVLPVTLLMGPQALQSPERTIQLAAAPLALDNGTQLTLATAMGKVEINISPAIKAADFNLVQQLSAMVDAQRAVTLTVQQMNGKLLASLIVPSPVAPTQGTAVQPSAPPQMPATAPVTSPSLPAPTQGMTLQAVVLPPPGTGATNIPAQPLPLTTYSPNATQTGLATYQQINAPVVPTTTPLPAPTVPAAALPLPPSLPQQGQMYPSVQPSQPMPRQASPQQSLPISENSSTLAPQPQPPQQAQQGAMSSQLPPHALFTGRTSPAALYATIQQAFSTNAAQPMTLGTTASPSPPAPNQQIPVQTVGTEQALPAQAAPPRTSSLPNAVVPQPLPAQPIPNKAPVAPTITAQAPTANPSALTVPQTPDGKSVPLPQPQQASFVQSDLPQRPLPPVLQQAGAQIQLRVITVLPAGTAPDVVQRNLANLPPNVIAATVTNQTPDGKVLASANGASFFINTPTSTPIGSTLIVAAEQAPEPFTVVLPQVDAASFPSLPPLLAALSQVAPLTYQQVLSRIPKTDDMAGALLSLLGANKRGNVREWIGESAAETLRNVGKGNLLTALTQDMKAGGMPAHDATVGDWRSYPIPLLHQGQFQSVMLYVHKDRDPHGSEGDNTDARSRFLIDVRLSKLGEMQLDGFVRNRKLDMILRSETPLPDGLHHEIRTAYMNAISAVGYAGSMNFQVGRQHWVVPQAGGKQILIT